MILLLLGAAAAPAGRDTESTPDRARADLVEATGAHIHVGVPSPHGVGPRSPRPAR